MQCFEAGITISSSDLVNGANGAYIRVREIQERNIGSVRNRGLLDSGYFSHGPYIDGASIVISVSAQTAEEAVRRCRQQVTHLLLWAADCVSSAPIKTNY
jgi:hypothetical protein